MTHSDIQKIKETKTLKLTKGQLFRHYAIVLFLLVAPLMTTYFIFQIFVTKNYTGVRSAQELILIGYPWVIPALFFYFLQKRRLRFSEIQLIVNKDEFVKAAELTTNKLGWTIKNISTDYISATRPGSFSSGSWGELVTIIRDTDKVLINRICDPDNFVSVASYGWNRKNVKTFKASLESLHTTRGLLSCRGDE